MFKEERQREIARIIQESGGVTIAELAQRYGVSEESLRRDLRALERQGLCQRTHGGAIRPQQVNIKPPDDRDFERMPVLDNYREIARAAVERIRENDVVYLTGGSFGYIMLQFLPRSFRFTLVVNCVDVAKQLRGWENIDVYIVGGRMRPNGTAADSLATAFVSSMHFDLCFLTGAGVTAQFGLSNGTDETATFQRAVMKNSRRRILLTPGEKVGRNAFIRVCPVEEFHEIITDWIADEEQLALIREAGVEVSAVVESK